MSKLISVLIALLFLNNHCSWSQDNDISATDILQKTIESTRQIKTISYTMTKTERIDGELITQISFSKLNRNPLKVYLRQEYPKEGMEVLFTNGEKVLVNPNGFPWFNLKLAPLGSMVRENQHHTIYESGYDHVINVFDHIVNKYQDEVENMLQIEKDTVWENHRVWKLNFQNPAYKILDYTMKEGENVMQLARSRMLSEYWVIENNKSLKSFDDEKPGNVIQIPNDYAPSMLIYIDKIRFIPLVMVVYDNHGLFEYYSYTNVEVNPTFKPIEFDRNCEEYGF